MLLTSAGELFKLDINCEQAWCCEVSHMAGYLTLNTRFQSALFRSQKVEDLQANNSCQKAQAMN